MGEIAITGEPAATLWCEGTGCRTIRRPRAAIVTLYRIPKRSMTPCCDECARRAYNRSPDLYELLPLDEYADLYGAARQLSDGTMNVGQLASWPLFDRIREAGLLVGLLGEHAS